jgi:hypothetical protein
VLLSLTVIVCDEVAVCAGEALSVTVRVAVYVPAAL